MVSNKTLLYDIVDDSISLVGKRYPNANNVKKNLATLQMADGQVIICTAKKSFTDNIIKTTNIIHKFKEN